jgi:protein-disulfide isomerase
MFWQFSDAVLSGSGNFDFDFIARVLRLNVKAFSACRTQHTYQNAILAQQAAGTAAGVQGTPTTFLLNAKGEVKIINGAVPVEQIQSAVNAMLQ